MSAGEDKSDAKPLEWVGSSLADLKRLPSAVQRRIGHNLYLVQIDTKPMNAKPLSGFGGASVLEIVEDHGGGTYRAVYTVRFREAVFVLHVFQKKSKKGIKTPKTDVDLIKARLKTASDLYESLYGGEKS
ncbi:type II toxin-antitoxin system RelE/ParE family toxin [Paludisphaera borealis]|uniref:Toxin HigB-2 n=1 Tax=Paludisphaera borealis TaxID=1387353 RepID=A0A1U7CUV3_9BACT|nr:type II toxin-antitoxin system RelE/ParE family toxin [Paludisphaera borealis]APW62669.1 hypothetical protein BSF38_04219 [Paludisphaera borealis]